MSFIPLKSKTAAEINNRIAASNHDEQTQDIKELAKRTNLEPSSVLFYSPVATPTFPDVPVLVNSANEPDEFLTAQAYALYLRTEFLKLATGIQDSSGLNQQQVNNITGRVLNDLASLSLDNKLKAGDMVFLKCCKTQASGGAGYYYITADTSTVADGIYKVRVNANLIATMVVEGSVDVSRFGAVVGTDVAPYLENAFKFFKDVTVSKDYTLESVIGLPDQNNYADTVIYLRGRGSPKLTVNCSSAVFTSAAAKADPTTLTNKFTGKIDISNINFIGTTVANSVVINGDRIYNVNIHHNNFKGNITIVKAYLAREAGRQYTQSISINNNHLANVYRVVESDKCYNLDFSYNMCEACIGGMYIGIANPWDPSIISLTIHRNLWEGSGVLFKTNGGLAGGTISSNYFENNTFNDAATDKCLISIDRTGTGTGYSSGVVITGNLFSGNQSIPDYVDVKINNQSTESTRGSRTALIKPPIFISNYSLSYKLTNFDAAVLINNKCNNRQLMRNAFSSQEGRFSFFSGYMEKNLTDILSSSILNFMNVDTRPCFTDGYVQSNFKVTLDVTLYFKASAVNTASCSFKLDVFVYTPYGAGTPPKSNLKCVMYNFMQSTTSDIVTGSNTMKDVISSAALTVTDNGDGTYKLNLGNFTNFASPSWGNISAVRLEYSAQATLIASASSAYSTANLIALT